MNPPKNLKVLTIVLVTLTLIAVWLGIQALKESNLKETPFLILAIVLAFASGAFGVYLVHRLTVYLDKLERRVGELEQAGQKRHTHATAAGLEDALAVLLDVLHEYQDSELYTKARLEQLGEILRIIRAGPNVYDTERPAGRRPTRRYEKRQ